MLVRTALAIAVAALAGATAAAGQGNAGRGGMQGPAAAASVDRGLTDPALRGTLDVHAHADPDSAQPAPRPVDVIELARMAQARGMRGFVVKGHLDQTAGLAYLARQTVPGVEVFGGITLNRAVGGVNVAAVEFMTNVKGGWGRVVWMPTFDTEDAARRATPPRPFVAVTRDGAVLPEVRQVLTMIAQRRTRDSNGELVLATGHLPAVEALAVLREAKRAGVRHMIATHPAASWTAVQLTEAADLGAYIEFQAQIFAREPAAGVADARLPYLAALRGVGASRAILSSDLGQAGNPLHPDGFVLAARWLRSQGTSDADLATMMRDNPARLLGLPTP